MEEEERMEEDLGPELDYKLSEGLRVIVSEGSAGVCLCARRVGEFNGSEDPGMLPEWAVHSIEQVGCHHPSSVVSNRTKRPFDT